MPTKALPCCSLQLWYWLAPHACCREAQESIAQQQRAHGDLVTTRSPTPTTVLSWKTSSETGPEWNNWRGEGKSRPTGRSGEATQEIFPQAEGKAPVAGPPAHGGLWGDREGGSGRVATQANAAGVLLSEMAPWGSLPPSAGELPSPRESPNPAWLGYLSGKGPFLGLSHRLWTPPCSAGAGIALSHLLSGGGCSSFLTTKADPAKHQMPLQLLAERQQPTQPSWRDGQNMEIAGSYFSGIALMWLWPPELLAELRWAPHEGRTGWGGPRGHIGAGGGQESKFPLWQYQDLGRNFKVCSSVFTISDGSVQKIYCSRS